MDRYVVQLRYIVLLVVLSQVAVAVQAQPAWLDRVETDEDFYTISIGESTRADMERATKFLAPVDAAPDRLHTVYQNVNEYRLHLEFMRAEFPNHFAGLSSDEYLDMVYYRNSRVYFSGIIYQFRTLDQMLYGFNVYHAPGEELTEDEAFLLYNRLSETFDLRPLAYSPISPAEVQIAKSWENPKFPVYLPEGLEVPEYEAYSSQTNYGRVRLFTLEEFTHAVNEGNIGWQDIVVIDEAPTDIENVVAGIITGTRQGELSHVNVRALRRKTPNAYIENPLQTLQLYDGQLVKLTITADGYQFDPNVTTEDAEIWWDKNRPSLPSLPRADDETAEFLELDQTRRGRFQTNFISTYGGKASHLAILYNFLDPQYQVEGFAIPFRYYKEFMQMNLIPSPNDATVMVTYEEYLSMMINNERFRSDSAYRRNQLNKFIDYARDYGTVNPELVTQLIDQIIEVFGSPSIKVRFRSSSNAEDSLEFSGAGLYDSTSVCVEDNLDGDNAGPSHCDPTKSKERTIERGLKKVWASLWNPKAFDEREYYQIDHEQIRMGVLVTRAFPDEDSNGVAFTGDPNTGEKYHYVVNVQLGDESVVQPGTGIVPEKVLIYTYSLEPGGEVYFQRIRQSSLMDEGQWILSDDELEELGQVLKTIDETMPTRDYNYQRKDIIFDVEFKFDNNQLVVKQVRPTLSPKAQSIDDLPDLKLIIPENTSLVGQFLDGRSLDQEYAMLSELHLLPGEYELPTNVSEVGMNLVDRIELGPDQTPLNPSADGKMLIDIYNIGDGRQHVQFRYSQMITAPNGNEAELTLSNIQFMVEDEIPELDDFVLTEEYISDNHIRAFINLVDQDYYQSIQFASKTYHTIPLFKHTVEFTDGTIEFYRRYLQPFAGSGPANLVYAVVDYQDQLVHQDSYWKLVYAAQHHNWDEQYRVVLNEPIGDVYGFDLDTYTFDNKQPEFYFLDENLERMDATPILNYDMVEVDELPGTPVQTWLMY